MSRFSFTGMLSNSLKNGLRCGDTKNGNRYESITLIINQSQNNSAFVKIFGYDGSIKTKDKNGNNIEIPFDGCEDKINDIADYCKFKIIDDTSKSFVSAYNFASYIKNNIDNFNQKNVTVSGYIKYVYYKDKWNPEFIVQKINIHKEEKKPVLKLNDNIFYEKESFDLSDWKKNKIITIYGYVECKQVESYVPMTFIFDASKIDFNNDNMRNLVAWRLLQLGLKLNDDNSITIKISRGIYASNVICKYINGAEEIPFDESQLTENQKYAIKIHAKTIDDFKPKGRIYGDKKTEIRIYDFNTNDEFANGYIIVDKPLDILRELDKTSQDVSNVNADVKEDDNNEIELF